MLTCSLRSTRVLVLLGLVLAGAALSGMGPDAVEADWERQREVRVLHVPVTPESDAAGACNGIISGLWGFHTEHEAKPWWQVDLGKPTPVGLVRVFNRCDGGFETRAARLALLLSEDGETFREVYRHDGTPFLGHPDSRPLEIRLEGERARFVRLQLPGVAYLHLDEVEIYAPGRDTNIALGKAATQSSTSPWSTVHDADRETFMGLDALVERGRGLINSIRLLDADADAEMDRLRAVIDRAAALPPEAGADAREAVRRDLLRATRALALRNPLLDFDELLFVKRAPGQFPHVSDQYYGWFSRGGGGIYILSDFRGDAPQVRCLTPDWPEGNFLRPDLSHDGRRVLFAYCRYYPHVAQVQDKTARDELPEDSFYHLYEMDLDGSNVRRLTRGRYNDMDARYLPNGDIVFLSTRKGAALQAGRESAQLTLAGTVPESYVRCGGDNFRPVSVYTLHRMDGDGGGLTAISAFENFEWTPAVSHAGEVLYARWDYIDRFNDDYMSLWSTRPDGTNAQLVYGNFTNNPQCIFEAVPIPGSHKLVFTATAHHSITGGSLVLLDRTRGTEYDGPLERITPEVCYPETECWPGHYYHSPWPLSEEHYLVAWADQPLPPHTHLSPRDHRNPANASGIYLYDVFGNLILLYRDPEISCETPIPVKPRSRPFQLADTVDWNEADHGAFLLQDVYQGMDDLPRGVVDRLRIVGVVPKVQPFMNQPVLGVSSQEPGKFVLGTVPVEPDGSAHFVVPSGVPVFFQALDRDHMAVRTMRSLTYVQPGTTLSCVGCHESRDAAPALQAPSLAARRAPSRITPEPEGTWPLRYDVLVQPVLDAACVRCHQPGYEDRLAAAFDLTGPNSYTSLIGYADNDIHDLAFEKSHSDVGDCVARQSKLMGLLTAAEGHEGVVLDDESIKRLKVWLDTYAQRQGAFSPEQEQELAALREQADWLVGAAGK